MVKIFIRHAEKEFRNNDSSRNDKYYYDPNLTRVGKKEMKRKFKELLTKYGPPKLLVVSPYLRTRRTTKVLLDLLSENKIEIPLITIDRLVGEYLGPRDEGKIKHIKEGLTQKTLSFDPIVGESREDFERRALEEFPDNCWIITHQAFLHHRIEISGYTMDQNKINYGAALIEGNDDEMVLWN